MAQTDNIYSSQDITDVKLYNDGYNNIIIIYVKKKPIDMFIMTYDSDHDEFFRCLFPKKFYVNPEGAG